MKIIAWKADKRWMIHANGLGWLLESRGPWQQKSSVGKSIFLEHRIMLVNFHLNSTYELADDLQIRLTSLRQQSPSSLARAHSSGSPPGKQCHGKTIQLQNYQSITLST